MLSLLPSHNCYSLYQYIMKFHEQNIEIVVGSNLRQASHSCPPIFNFVTISVSQMCGKCSIIFSMLCVCVCVCVRNKRLILQ